MSHSPVCQESPLAQSSAAGLPSEATLIEHREMHAVLRQLHGQRPMFYTLHANPAPEPRAHCINNAHDTFILWLVTITTFNWLIKHL